MHVHLNIKLVLPFKVFTSFLWYLLKTKIKDISFTQHKHDDNHISYHQIANTFVNNHEINSLTD